MSVWQRVVGRLTGRTATTQLESVKALVRKSTASAHDDVTGAETRLRSLIKAASAPAAKQVGELQELRQSVADLRQSVGGVRSSLTRLTSQVELAQDPLFAAGRVHMLSLLEKIAARPGPLLVGPWTGEVGFELLYWIPFLRWVESRFALDPSRQLIVSRGGTASWYGVPEERYAEVFSVVSGDEFRALTGDQRTLKQQGIDPFHGRIIEELSRRRGQPMGVLHPSLMFKAFRQFWDDSAGYARVAEFTKYTLLTPPLADLPAGLPPGYVAVRFYFRRSFPDTPQNRAFAQSVVSSLAERGPVVLLASGARVDDHSDWLPEGIPNVTVVGAGPVERNLAVQSAVIGGARAFVGTYGGYSYLAPLYRVPTIAFYSRSRRRFDWSHLSAAERAFDEIGAAPMTVVPVRQTPLVHAALAAVGAQPA